MTLSIGNTNIFLYLKPVLPEKVAHFSRTERKYLAMLTPIFSENLLEVWREEKNSR